jgi:Trk-type K+ transport system membrane component
MIIGGTAGSTSGGIKTIRAVMMGNGVGWWLKKIALPEEAVIPFRSGKTLSEAHKNAEFGGGLTASLIYGSSVSWCVWWCSCVWLHRISILVM